MLMNEAAVVLQDVFMLQLLRQRYLILQAKEPLTSAPTIKRLFGGNVSTQTDLYTGELLVPLIQVPIMLANQLTCTQVSHCSRYP